MENLLNQFYETLKRLERYVPGLSYQNIEVAQGAKDSLWHQPGVKYCMSDHQAEKMPLKQAVINSSEGKMCSHCLDNFRVHIIDDVKVISLSRLDWYYSWTEEFLKRPEVDITNFEELIEVSTFFGNEGNRIETIQNIGMDSRLLDILQCKLKASWEALKTAGEIESNREALLSLISTDRVEKNFFTKTLKQSSVNSGPIESAGAVFAAELAKSTIKVAGIYPAKLLDVPRRGHLRLLAARFWITGQVSLVPYSAHLLFLDALKARSFQGLGYLLLEEEPPLEVWEALNVFAKDAEGTDSTLEELFKTAQLI